MRYFALATDYDGTLATDGKVASETLAALQRLRESGRKLILVTGRHLGDLQATFPEVEKFDCVVAENGALLYFPQNRETFSLGNRPPEKFIQALRDRQVQPIDVGEVIVSTWHPHENTVLEVIRQLGLDLQIIFNKGAVMMLPSGINKAAGLQAALIKMELSPHNVVAVGDAENDHAFMKICEISVAVDNALPAVKESADWVTAQPRGAGVIELIDQMITSDLAEIASTHHQILLGTENHQPVHFPAYGKSLMLAGSSGSGKSTLATAILERFADQNYQFCIIDPEGDYEGFTEAIILGSAQKEPQLSELLEILRNPAQNVVVNLLGVKLDQRPAFFAGLLPALLEMRAKTGRPHWLVVDEVHHLLPSTWDLASLTLPQVLPGILMITVHPNYVAVPALSLVNAIITVGKNPQDAIATFCQAVGTCPPHLELQDLATGQAAMWFRDSEQSPFCFQIAPPKMERRRHMRNYAEGELGEDKCFYFRGQNHKLNLKAQNLIMFTQLAQGIDEETWLYHLQRQDYSQWFRNAIKDEILAAEAAQIEGCEGISAQESRDRIIRAIDHRYTLPA